MTVIAHGFFGEALEHWSNEPFTLTLILISATLYGAGLYRLWSRAGIGHGIRRSEAFAFASGLLSLVIALLSPIVWLSQRLFSVLMGQHEILMLIAQGSTNADIAARLVLSPKTVRNHVSNILSKLQVADRAEAILRARDAGRR